MVLCKYFAKGTCRYGNKCRFDHTPPSQTQSYSQNPWGGNQYNNRNAGNRGFPDKDVTPSPQQYIELIAQEMAIWDVSGMWPFSCYSYSKGGACLSGFDDISPEELRFDAYNTQKENTFSVHQQKVSQLASEYSMRRSDLKNSKTMNVQVRQKLIQEIQNENTKSASQSSSNSCTTSSNPFFGGNVNDATQSSFGGSVFGGSSLTSSTFGSAQNSSSQTAPFGSALNSFSFKTPTEPSKALNAFSFKSPSEPGNALNTFSFKPPSESGTSNQFAGQIGGQVGTNAFPSAPPTTPAFFQQPFSTPSNSQNTLPFSDSTGKTVNQNTGIFGQTTTSIPTSLPETNKQGSNVSSSVPSSAPSRQATGGQHQLGLYSVFDQLSEMEREQFKADKFSLGKIPMVPPPLEMI